MTNIIFPRWMLDWIDSNRGDLSRQSFIVNMVRDVITSNSKYNA